MTACVWMRGLLHHEYGVAPADIRWRNGGQEEPGRTQKVQVQLPDDVELQPIPADETLNGMLDRGDLDALIAARAPSCLERNDKVARLFPDYRTDEEAYYAKTGMFPIMHLVGIRRSIVEQHPWLPVNVYLGYLEAKRICYRRQAEVGHLHTTLPWPVDEFEKARALMGEDFWPYGLEVNSKEVETLIRYSHEQGLTEPGLSPRELFAETTREVAKI